MKKESLLLFFLLISLKVVTAQDAPMYEQVSDNQPGIGIQTEVYLGDRMLTQREGEFRDCIVPKKAYERKALGVTWRIKARQPLCKKDADAEFYHPNYYILAPSKDNTFGVFVRLVEKKGKYEIHICQGKMLGKGGICVGKLKIKGLDEGDLEVNDRYFLYTENTFQQSIEYAGRNGDNLKFLYSEFTDGFARQAFNREFQVDYSEGNVAAYKGAIIEIHEATNTNIVYSVIRNFRD